MNTTILMSWLYAIIAFFQMSPYFFWTTYNGGEAKRLVPIFLMGSLVSALLVIFKRPFKITIGQAVLILWFLGNWVYQTNINADKPLIFTPGAYLPIMVILGFLLLEESDRKYIFTKFLTVFCIMLIPSIVIWFFFNLGIDIIPSGYIESEHSMKAANGVYYLQYFCAVVAKSGHSDLMRISGVFDEPGVVGTFAALFLTADDIRLKGKPVNIIVLIAGILSFSLTFYFLITMAFIIKRYFTSALKCTIALILVLFLFSIPTMLAETVPDKMDIDNEYINRLIMARIVFQDGSLSGNNRTTQHFEYEFDHFLEEDIFRLLLGHGIYASQNNPYMFGSASYKMLIYDYGFIGFVSMMSWLFYAFLKYGGSDKKNMIFTLVFFASIYQRPYVFDIPYLVLLLGGYANLNSIE